MSEAKPTSNHPNPARSPYVVRGVGSVDRLQRLWAGYRMSYITARPDSTQNKGAASPPAPKKKHDPFIEAPKKSDEDGLIIARGEHVYCLLNLYPYNAGHLMVVPFRKVANLEELNREEAVELMDFMQRAIVALKTVSTPEFINVGFNLGKSAGGSVGDHLHMHLVPRWPGDMGTMTILEDPSVLPEMLKDTRALLADAWPTQPVAGCDGAEEDCPALSGEADRQAGDLGTPGGAHTPGGISAAAAKDPLQELWVKYQHPYILERPQGDEDPYKAAPDYADEDSLIVARGEHVYAMLTLQPYNAGHLMVVPYRQVSTLEALSSEECAEMIEFIQHAIIAIRKVSNPDAFNVGRAPTAGVGAHAHMHVVPRWPGDANFMTVLTSTKVLPQLLKDTRTLVANAWPQRSS